MKNFKLTMVTASWTMLACGAFAQAPAAQTQAAAPATAPVPAPAQAPAAEAVVVASNEDRSYVSDYTGKNAEVNLFDEASKKETPVTFKASNPGEIVFSGGGGELTVSKKTASALKVIAKLDSNWNRARNAYNQGNWDDVVAYMRPMVYPLIPLLSLPEETFKGYGYVDMYLAALVNAGRLKEAESLVNAIYLNDCAPQIISSALSVANALAAAGNVKAAMAIAERVPFTGAYVSVIPDLMNTLGELRRRGMVEQAGLLYTKITGVDSPYKTEATLWMVFCDLSMNKKMSAEIYLSKMEILQTAREFSLLQMARGMLAAKAEKPDYSKVLDLYAEGIVFGSLSSPWMPELLYNAGMTYKKLGKQYPANEIFSQMASLYPDDPFTAKGQKEIVKVERKKKAAEEDEDE